jgi:hypothetical protein
MLKCASWASTQFGFSWILPVSRRTPSILGVGFPWISLDSLVRIETYQWVARDFRSKKFRATFLSVTAAPGWASAFGTCGSTASLMVKLSLISDFLQEIAARVVSVWPLPSTRLSLARLQRLAPRASAVERIVRIPGVSQRLEAHSARVDHQQPPDQPLIAVAEAADQNADRLHDHE